MTEVDISLAPEYATNLLNGTPPADVVITLSPLYDVEIDQLGTTPSIELVLSNIFQGPQGEQGPIGPPGPTGAGSATSYVYTQASASAMWTINHQLGRFPSVTVVDSSGREIEGDVVFVDSNHVTVSFAFPFAGQAFLN